VSKEPHAISRTSTSPSTNALISAREHTKVQPTFKDS